ncbi:MAG: MarR family winged helix-turn-helix transcriptional regulator [Candidatus Thorarchaeota archaeon]
MSKETRKMAEVFSYLFVLSQRIEYIIDSFLDRYDLTTKQLLTLIAIGNAFDYNPSLSEVADVLSTSHQNVKQIALNLRKRGFVDIVVDPQDRRRRLLQLTADNDTFWEEREKENYENMKKIFSSLSKSEMAEFHRIIVKLLSGLQGLYTEIRG